MRNRASESAVKERWGVAIAKKQFSAKIYGLALLTFISFCAIETVEGAQDLPIEFPNKAVTRKVLDNGLTILAARSPSNGLVAIDAKVLAGSSLEGEYLGSGIAHLVEHMLFKGTTTRKVGEIEAQVKACGGYINGSDSRDITDYRIILPVKHLSKGLDIIKDMLLNASFDEGELSKEKEVILSEIRLNEDEPISRLIKRLHETAYLRHPYKYPPIGYQDKFSELTRDDVVSYYNKMYVPNRIVLTIVGDIDPAESAKQAAAMFSDFRPPDYSAIGIIPEEPKQLGKRILQEDSKVNLAYLAIGFHSTSYLNKDLFAMDVLAMILGRGDQSRLNKLLRHDRSLVYSISAWNHTPMDPGLFVIDVILDKKNCHAAKKAIMKELARMRFDLVSDSELNKAKRTALVDYLAGLETADGLAHDIGINYIITGSPDFSKIYVDGIQSVTKEDIKRVANEYLNSDNMTLVELIPGGTDDQNTETKTRQASGGIEMSTLANGLRIISRRDDKIPMVSITAAIRGGILVESTENNGISALTAKMLLSGTPSRTAEEIYGTIEDLGGNITSFSGISTFGVNMEVLKSDLPVALYLLNDILLNSEFPKDEMDKEITLTMGQISQEDDDIFARGVNTLRSILFNESPYSLRYNGTTSSVSSIRRKDIISFYSLYGNANNMVISISGDIDPEETLDMATRIFSTLQNNDVQISMPDGPRISGEVIKEITMNKEQGVILNGYETVALDDPDRYPLDVLNSVLTGQSGRLYSSIRGTEGLAYAVGSVHRPAVGRGFLILYVATSQDGIEKSRQLLSDEISDIIANGITEKELKDAKSELAGSRMVESQTNNFYSLTTAIDELNGLGYNNIDDYRKNIESVTIEDIDRVIKKYLNSDSYVTVIISSPEEPN